MVERAKDSMLSLDIYAWMKENRSEVEGGFIKKIYQVGEREFLLKIYKNETKTLYINLRGFVFFGERETPEKPSMFAMYLRKRFNNKKILGFEQVNFDRIIIFKTPEYDLIFELFGGGNVIVVKDGIIEKAYKEREWRHRSIMRGELYHPPEEKKHPLKDIDSLCDVVNSSSKDVVRAIATGYNLGRYSEEVCYRAGVDKNKKGVTDEECEKLKKAIREIFEFDGCYLYRDFFSPVPLKYRKEEYEKFESMNECLDRYLSSFSPEVVGDLRLHNIKEMQLKKIEEFKEEERKNREIGDKIYEHFQEVEEIIQKAKRGEVEKDGKSRVIVNFDGLEFYIYANKSPGENATIYYDKAKKAREKIKGAMKAIEEIEEKIKKEKKKEVKKKKRRRVFWFEKYRWFISSEDFLVIAGRDAKTNEEVVKKHLGDKDLYMHADIHGAPSVVIKSEGREIGEKTLYEAAQFAVSMSKAWNAGFGNMSAYWVYPSQVSKMGESGEYVARGSWVIRGKRNYFHKVPLSLAIGKINYQGTELLMCGPESAVAKRTEKYVVIAPGDEKKEAFARRIAGEFDASVDEIIRILPPGKIKIIRRV